MHIECSQSGGQHLYKMISNHSQVPFAVFSDKAQFVSEWSWETSGDLPSQFVRSEFHRTAEEGV